MPIAGLGTVGSSLGFNIPTGSLLTGTLTDGTPIAITGSNVVEVGDVIADGTLTLRRTAIPAAPPIAINAPGGATPHGIRAGQSLNVSNGATVGSGFNASWGSTVTITGGQVGDNFEAVGAVVNISGGSIGGLSNAFMGSVVNLSGGSIGGNFTAARGSQVNMTGGSMDGSFEVQPGAVANLSGGTVEDNFRMYPGSQVKISGGDFRLNGAPISGLASVGSSRAFDIPSGSTLSGTFSDGTPFAFSDEESDFFAPGTLTLSTTAVPTVGTAVIQVPHDPAPKGLRMGQSMIVSAGGVVGDNFTANWGSSVTVTGGQIGDSFKAVGALVNISGGTFTGRFRAAYGSVVNITGGEFQWAFACEKGSVVNMSGGSLDYLAQTFSGSVLNVSGGTIGSNGYFYEGSVVNLSGGSIGDGFYIQGGTVNMTGGSIGQGTVAVGNSVINLTGGTLGHGLFSGGRVVVVGTDFRLNGAPINIDYGGQQVPIDLASGVLSGTLEDGTPFTFSSDLGDHLQGSLLVQLAYSSPPSVPAVIQVPSQAAPVGIRGGQSLVLTSGGAIGDGFRMGWGSTLTMNGGAIGDNLEAVGANVLIAGGSVGNNFSVLYGTTLTVRAGTIGNQFVVGNGGTVNMTGGTAKGITAKAGSVINISGGVIGNDYGDAAPQYPFEIDAGSELHLFGTHFELNGVPIADLVPGVMTTITNRPGTLTGILADGSPFHYLLIDQDVAVDGYICLNALVTLTPILMGDYNDDGVVDMADYTVIRAGLGTRFSLVDYNAWRSHFGETARSWAAGVSNSTVPEPSAAALIALTSAACIFLRSRRGQ